MAQQPILVPSPHPNGGMLWKGGVPGNKGGGRPSKRMALKAAGLLEAIDPETGMDALDVMAAIVHRGQFDNFRVQATLALKKIASEYDVTPPILAEDLEGSVLKRFMAEVQAECQAIAELLPASETEAKTRLLGIRELMFSKFAGVFADAVEEQTELAESRPGATQIIECGPYLGSSEDSDGL